VIWGFLIASAYSLRNIIFVAPALFFQIAASADRKRPVGLRAVVLAGSAAAAAALVWATVLGPAHSAAYLRLSPAEYALKHPPRHGRIAALGGLSSYLLWRMPRTKVVIDGWLEHFSPAELRANYSIVRARPGVVPDVARWNVGAVITRHREAVKALKAQGFVLKYTAPEGIYLVQQAPSGGARAQSGVVGLRRERTLESH
jgi:hypothetical protein